MNSEQIIALLETEASRAHDKYLETYALDTKDERDYWDTREEVLQEMLNKINKETTNA